MPILDPRHHPFERARLFEQMGISPYATAEELAQAADRLDASVGALPAGQQDHRRAIAKALRDSIADLRERAVLAATCMDRLRQAELLEPLAEARGFGIDKLSLPAMGLDLLLVDGEDLALAEEDMEEIHPDDDMMPDFGNIQRYLEDQPCEMHFIFDL